MPCRPFWRGRRFLPVSGGGGGGGGGCDDDCRIFDTFCSQSAAAAYDCDVCCCSSARRPLLHRRPCCRRQTAQVIARTSTAYAASSASPCTCCLLRISMHAGACALFVTCHMSRAHCNTNTKSTPSTQPPVLIKVKPELSCSARCNPAVGQGPRLHAAGGG